MITLYGFAISNYYNKAKFALLEKGIVFQEQMAAPSQDPAFLARSPLGKIPFIETPSGFLSESQAIIEYLEDAYPQIPLYPADAYQRAKCRELLQHLELNVELIARRLYGEVLFGKPVSAEIKDEVKLKLQIGLSGLAKLLQLRPYALGEQFGMADIMVWPHLQLVGFVTEKIYGEDLVKANIPDIADYLALIEARPHAQTVSQARAAALAQFFNKS